MKYKFLRAKAVFEIFLVITVSIFISLSLNTKEAAADSNGCCVVDEQCSEGVSQATCTSNGGAWGSGLCSEGANVALCIRGCCVIGDNAVLTTRSSCTELFDGVYNPDINTQDSCTNLVAGSDEGCCASDGSFRYMLRGNCDGTFFKNTLCKNVEGYDESGYTSHSKYECGPSGTSKENDVYWYDSAGNLEDIKEDCNPSDLSRATSVCGNSEGNYKCESLDCETTWDNPSVDYDGGFRKNGESWCEYQAAVGPGLDLPGTQHFVHKCEKGKEIVEECAPDRSTICVQNSVNYGNDVKLSTANCVENTADACITCGSDENCCKESSLNCVYGGGKCLPMVPPAGSNYCSQGNVESFTYWAKKCGGSWRCYKGCEAYSTSNLASMNSFCGAFGDCGAKWNLAEDYTNTGSYRACPDKPNIAVGGNKNEGCLHNLPAENNLFDSFKNAGQGLFLGEINVEDLGIDKDSIIKGGNILLGLVNHYISNSFSGSVVRRAGISGVTTPFYGTLVAYGVVLGLGTLLGLWEISFTIGAAFGPYGLIAAAIVVVVSILVAAFTNWKAFVQGLGKLFKCSDDAIRTQPTFSCGAWQVPKGGDNCYKCNTKKNDGGLLPDYKFDNSDGYSGYECTENLCESLGTQCEFKGEEPTGPRCVKVSTLDINAPVINIDYGNTKYYCNSEAPEGSEGCSENPQSGISVVSEGGLEKGFVINGLLIDLYEGAVNKKLPLNISIKTNEDALCRYNFEDSEFGNMLYEFVEKGLEGGHTTIHTLSLKGSLLTSGEHNLYARCEDWNQNPSTFSYVIRYSVAKQPDFSPPIIEQTTPEDGSYVKFGETKQLVELRINEPIYTLTDADLSSTDDDSSIPDSASNEATRPGCKWSKEPNKIYDEMTNSLFCNSDDLTCKGELDLVSGENKFYFRCKDSSGNANDQDYSYTLKSSTSKLDISSANCEHMLPDGMGGSDCGNVYARNFTMVVNTAGGADGISNCRFSGFGSGEFFETGSTVHKQQFGGDGSISQGFSPGSYSINLKCIDKAENEAEKTVDINIKIDNNNPKITRFYVESNNLYILTDEYARCYYTNTREFSYDSATSMSSDGTKHNTAASDTYYRIGCVDRFNNYMTPVSIYL